MLKNKANQLLEPKHRPSDSSASTTPSIPLLEGMANIGHVSLGSQAGESAFTHAPRNPMEQVTPGLKGTNVSCMLLCSLWDSSLLPLERGWV